MDISTCLKELRHLHHLTQKQLAQRFGVSVTTISAYEIGSNQPPYDMLCKYADIFHVSTDFILGRDTENLISLSDLSAQEQRAIRNLVWDLSDKGYNKI